MKKIVLDRARDYSLSSENSLACLPSYRKNFNSFLNASPFCLFVVLWAVIAVLSFSGCSNPWWPHKDSYTVTFHANGGKGTVPEAQSVVARSSITLPHGNGLSKDGHSFAGWNKKHTGDGDHHHAGSSFTPTDHITLYAKWVAGENIPYNPVTEAPVTSNPVTGTGTSSGRPFSNPQINAGPPFKVTYMAGNNLDVMGDPPVDKKEYPVGSDVTVLRAGDCTLDYPGYKLVGWAPPGGPVYGVGETFRITAHTVLYPEWVRDSDKLLVIGDLCPKAEKPYGYDQDDELIRTIAIMNNTGHDLAPLYLTELTGNLDKFEIHTDEYEDFNKSVSYRARTTGADKIKTGTFATRPMEHGDEVVFVITAKEGLPVGNYSIKITINEKEDGSSDITATFYMTFEVKPIPLRVEVTDPVYTNPGNVLTPIVWDNGATPSYTERAASFVVTVSGFKDADRDVANSLALTAGIINAGGYIKPIDGLNWSGTGDGTPAESYNVVENGKNKTYYKKTFNAVKVILSDTHEFAEGKAEVFFGLVGTLALIDTNYEIHSMTEEAEEIKIIDGWTALRPIPVYGDLVNNSDDNVRIKAFNYYAGTTNGLKRHYIQTENITLTAPVAPATRNWTAIGTGTGAASFTGSYDGGGKTITGLKVNSSNDNQGMFGYTGAGSKVHNLGLVDVYIEGKGNVGGVVGRNEGTVQYCYTSNGTIKATGGSGGGIVGSNAGGVQYCYASNNTVTTGANNTGGVVGWNGGGGVVQNCYATGGTVTGTYYVGGVLGMSNGTSGSTVDYCYSTSEEVKNTTKSNNTPDANGVGGVLGYVESGGKTRNNVALNKKITSGTSLTGIGRVIGLVKNTSTPNNNYARSDMQVNTLNSASPLSYNGTGVSASGGTYNWSDSSFWTTKANWADVNNDGNPDPWDPAIWDFSGSLPMLKGMPGGPAAQDPQVQ